MKKRPNWKEIEKEYRAGVLSVNEIARRNGITHAPVLRKAKREGWTRDLSNKVRKKTREELLKGTGTNEGTRHNAKEDEEIVDQAVSRTLQVVECHRKDINSGRGLCNMLFGQLEEAATARDEIADEIADETKDDKTINRRNQMLRAVALPAHASIMRDLSTAMKNLIGMERQAFGLDIDYKREKEGNQLPNPEAGSVHINFNGQTIVIPREQADAILQRGHDHAKDITPQTIREEFARRQKRAMLKDQD